MLSFFAAAVSAMFAKPKPPPAPAFDSVAGFVSFVRENGGSVADDALSDAEFEIAAAAERAGFVRHHESTWGASDWFYLA